MSSRESNPNPYAIAVRNGILIYRLPSEMLKAVSSQAQEIMLLELRRPEKPKQFIFDNIPIAINRAQYKWLLNCRNDQLIRGKDGCNYNQRFDQVLSNLS